MLIFQGMIRLDFVVDAACVGLEDPIKGHVPVGFIVIDKSKLSANAVLRQTTCSSWTCLKYSRSRILFPFCARSRLDHRSCLLYF